MLQRDQANGFLSKFDLSVDDLLAEVPDIGENDVLMLIGSVADGLGTPLSDIDIMVVGERRPDQDLVLRESNRERAIRRIESGQEINIEYWDWSRVKTIADKFSASTFAIDNPTSTNEIIVFDDEELRILHYFINGLLLSGKGRIFADVFEKESLMDYLVMYFMTRYLALAEDSIGQVLEDDLECASFDLRLGIEFLIGAEIASLGYTHPYLRWRLKFLRACRAEIGEDVFKEYVSYLLGIPGKTKEDIEAGLKFAQSRLGAIFMRRPKVFVAAGALSDRMKFVTSFEA